MARTFLPHVISDDSALGGSVIEKSLRFNGQTESTAPQLRRTGTTTSSSFSIAMWAKLSRVSDQYKMFFSIGQENDANAAWVAVLDGQNMGFQGGNGTYTTIARLFRDPTSWFHFLISVNSNNFTVYIDGTSVQTGTIRSLDTSTNGIRIGANYGSYYPWNGYLADVYLIDGQAKAPTDFGYTESQTGIWRPKKYTGTFGTGGAHLEFKDSSSVTALGKDTSGNGNDFTPTTNGFNVTAGAGNDSVTDTPTNNFCTMNPLDMHSSMSIKNGNLQVGEGNDWRGIKGTFGVSSGKWYYEFKTGNSNIFCGWVADDTTGTNNISTNPQDSNSAMSAGVLIFCDNGKIHLDTGGSENRTNYSSALSANDILGCAIDLDKNTAQFYKNGSALGSIDISSSKLATKRVLPYFICHPFDDPDYTFNFGQQAFAYTPPTGYKTLSSQNLLPPNAPSIVRPKRHFDVLLYSGDNATSRSITGLEFVPDLIIQKRRSAVSSFVVWDSVRGVNKTLYTEDTYAETTSDNTGYITEFGSNGYTFSLSSGSEAQLNASGHTYCAWCWKAGGTAVSNSDGTITSSVSANTEAGFSIVSFTGNATSGATVGHGLNSKPKWFIIKERGNTNDWVVYHESLGSSSGNTNVQFLNLSNDIGGGFAGGYNNTAPTSSVFSLGNSTETNRSGGSFIAYCWSEVPGFSKFGSYTGNGSTSGTYVDLGFRPAFILLKRYNSAASWVLHDYKRSGYNGDNDYFHPDTTQAESDGSSGTIDFLSNGFKLRMTAGTHNGDGDTYIYMAFAEQPGVTPFDTFPSAH